jgi:uncharacterized lipoprotein YmbA
MRTGTLRGIALFCLMLVLLAGCSRSPRVAFYTLNATATPEAATQALEAVVIGPVTLPDLLDRPQFVVSIDANRVDILEMQRWAAPLKSEIPRVIAEDLAALLKPTRVSAYPQTTGFDAVYRVQIDIQRLEMTEGKGVALDALWSIRRSDGGSLKSGRTVVNEPVTIAGYEPLVAAQSRALVAVSRDLAQALRSVAAPAK